MIGKTKQMKIILMAKMKNTPPFQDATAIIMNQHHESVTVTKCAGKQLQNTFVVFGQFLPTKTLLLLQ